MRLEFLCGENRDIGVYFDVDAPEKNQKLLSDEFCREISDDYKKLRAISNWVSENIYYDLDALSPGGSSPEVLSLDYVLKNKRSLCGGFSNITAALCAT